MSKPDALKLADELEAACPFKESAEKMAAAELRRLHAENEALRKDAERYRWLRHGDNDEEVLRFHDWATEVCVDPPPMYLPRLERLDRLIDEAMKEQA